jgi:hypothetical protein
MKRWLVAIAIFVGSLALLLLCVVFAAYRQVSFAQLRHIKSDWRNPLPSLTLRI